MGTLGKVNEVAAAGAWQKIVDQNSVNASSHDFNIGDNYDVMFIIFSTGRIGATHRPAIRFNDDAGNNYTTIYTYNREASGPLRTSIVSNNRFFLFTADVQDGQPASYSGTLIRGPSPGVGVMVHQSLAFVSFSFHNCLQNAHIWATGEQHGKVPIHKRFSSVSSGRLHAA